MTAEKPRIGGFKPPFRATTGGHRPPLQGGAKATRECSKTTIFAKNAGLKPKKQQKASTGKGCKMKKPRYIAALQSYRAAMQRYMMTPQSCGAALQPHIVVPQSYITTPQSAW